MANRFLRANVNKKVKFMGEEIEITKLSVAQVIEIQERAKTLAENPSELENLEMLALVVKLGAPELADMSQDELFQFSLDELSRLSADIMKHSGMGQDKKDK